MNLNSVQIVVRIKKITNITILSFSYLLTMQALVLQLPSGFIDDLYMVQMDTILRWTSGCMRAFLFVAQDFDDEAIAALSRYEHLEYTVVAHCGRVWGNPNSISQQISLNRKHDELLVFGTEWAHLYPVAAAADGKTATAPVGRKSATYQIDAAQQINKVVNNWETFDPFSLTFAANENVVELVSPFVADCAGLKHATLLHTTFRITVRNVNDGRSIDVIITSLAAIPLLKRLPSYDSDDRKLACNLVFMGGATAGSRTAPSTDFFPLTSRAAIETMQFEKQPMFIAFLEYLTQNVGQMAKFFQGLKVISGPITGPADPSSIELRKLDGLLQLEWIFFRESPESPLNIRIPDNFQIEADAIPCYVALTLINGTPPNGICIRLPKRVAELVVHLEN